MLLLTRVVKRVSFTLKDKSFVHDLLCLPLNGIDVIYEIEWLLMHYDAFDCLEKIVLMISIDILMMDFMSHEYDDYDYCLDRQRI